MSKSEIKFPFILERNIGKWGYDKWRKFYNRTVNGHDCFKEEGLWRRSQEEINKEHSGWSAFNDKRRRIIHYEHEFCVRKRGDVYNFFLNKVYIWINLCLPFLEIDEYFMNIAKGLENNYWWRKNNDLKNVYACKDLFLELKKKNFCKEDIIDKRFFPKNYKVLELTIYSKNNIKSKDFYVKPWLVLKSGIRKKDVRGTPLITRDPAIVLKYLPAQIELGGGASMEVGIFPLNFLHKVYSIIGKENKFVFNFNEDEIVKEIIDNPKKSLKKIGLMQRSILKAKLNDFYKALKILHRKGFFVGPIITNNFDGLVRRIGLKEMYVRKYDDNIFPRVKFHKNAKSLIVVGSHADRRHIQRSAREKGLKVVYIDPERYVDKDGNVINYPLESPQDEDIIINNKASVVFKYLQNHLA